ncbi:MAG: metal ABC transporter ATP-binding protein [Armatimonadota bacterium]
MLKATDNKEIQLHINEMLSFDHADLGYGNNKVLCDLNFVLNEGDFLGIVGPNGTGKTTMLKAMLGILKPLAGHVHRNSETRFGYVPQRQFIDEVFPLTVMDIALMGRYPLLGAIRRPSRRDRDYALECLSHVGIADLAQKAYRELSGGQKQRALIARALAAEPKVMILDEPTNDMDIGSEHAIMELLSDLHESDNITIVMVSHLLNVIINYVEKIALIDGGLRMIGNIDEVLSSKNLSDIYEVGVEVGAFGGQRVIVTGGRDA